MLACALSVVTVSHSKNFCFSMSAFSLHEATVSRPFEIVSRLSLVARLYEALSYYCVAYTYRGRRNC